MSAQADTERQESCSEARKSTCNLAEMLDRVTPENLHPEVDFGEPEGEEQW